MKVENSIEEDIILLKDFTEGNFKRDKLENYKGSCKMGYFYYKDIQQAIEHILRDYKRVLKEHEYMHNELNKQETTINKYAKENEELKEDRKNNNEMISLAQNKILNYMRGYEDGKKHKMTAVAQVVENQQYYIVQKQMEKYEELIKRLQKENEELKILKSGIQTLQNLGIEDGKYIVMSKTDFLNGSCKHLLDDYIPIQKVKDIIDRIDYDIKKTKEIISKNTNIHATYRKNDYQIVRLRAMNTKSLDIKKRLQKLLESEE